MLDLLLESALRSLALGVAVWLGLALLRVRNPRTQMTAWSVVLVASLAIPVLMHRLTVTIPAAAPPLRVVESLSSRLSAPRSEPVEVPAVRTPGPLALPPATERSAMPIRRSRWCPIRPIGAGLVGQAPIGACCLQPSTSSLPPSCFCGCSRDSC